MITLVKRLCMGACGSALALTAFAGTAQITGHASLAVITLSASNTDGGPGHPVTLTATSNVDVGPTPYYLDIYDVSSGTLLTACGYGTTCDVSTEIDSCTSHSYRAYIGDPSSTPPPTNNQGSSNTVSVEWWGLSLTASPTGQVVGSPITLRASTCRDVLATPYFISTYNGTTTLVVGTPCGEGTSCSNQDTELAPVCITFHATIATTSATYPPPSTVAETSAQACWGV